MNPKTLFDYVVLLVVRRNVHGNLETIGIRIVDTCGTVDHTENLALEVCYYTCGDGRLAVGMKHLTAKIDSYRRGVALLVLTDFLLTGNQPDVGHFGLALLAVELTTWSVFVNPLVVLLQLVKC